MLIDINGTRTAAFMHQKRVPAEIDFLNNDFNLLLKKNNNNEHLYFYWNLNRPQQIENFNERYNDSYNLKYTGMLQAIKFKII